MNHPCRRILACLALALASIGVTVTAEALPASATVSTNCTAYWYKDGTGHLYKMFSVCQPGSQYSAQRARINCDNFQHYEGAWQYNPGPWYGSTATCLNGSHALGGSIGFK